MVGETRESKCVAHIKVRMSIWNSLAKKCCCSSTNYIFDSVNIIKFIQTLTFLQPVEM